MIGQQKFFQDSKQTQPVYMWRPCPCQSLRLGIAGPLVAGPMLLTFHFSIQI